MKERNFILLFMCFIMLGMIITQDTAGDSMGKQSLRPAMRKLALKDAFMTIAYPEIIKVYDGEINLFIISTNIYDFSDLKEVFVDGFKEIKIGTGDTTEHYEIKTESQSTQLFLYVKISWSRENRLKLSASDGSTRSLLLFSFDALHALVKRPPSKTDNIEIPINMIASITSGTLKIDTPNINCEGKAPKFKCTVEGSLLSTRFKIIYEDSSIKLEAYFTIYTEETCHIYINGIAVVLINGPTDESTPLRLKIDDRNSMIIPIAGVATFTFEDPNKIEPGKNKQLSLMREGIDAYLTGISIDELKIITPELEVYQYSQIDFSFEFTTSIIDEDHLAINYGSESNPLPATYVIVTDTPTKITVVAADRKFDSPGTYVFTIKDKKFPTRPLTFTVNAKAAAYPPKPTLSNNGIFYYSGDPLSSDSFVEFTSPVADISIFPIIKVTKKSNSKTVEFKLVEVEGGDKKEFTLEITSVIDGNLYWGKYDNIIFYQVDKTTAQYTIETFIMINEPSLPKTLGINYTKGVYVTKKSSTIDVLFEQEIYSEYFEGTPPFLSIADHTLSVKSENVDKKIMTIEKTDGKYFTAETILELKRDTSKLIDITILSCPTNKVPSNNVCAACIEPKPLYDFAEGTCVDKCTAFTGLDSTKKICNPIEIQSIKPATLYAEKVSQEFNILFIVEADLTKVKGFGLFGVTGDTVSESEKKIPDGICTLDSTVTAKNVFKCKSFISLAKGDYNLYWYNDNKVESGFHKITLVEYEKTGIDVVKITPTIQGYPLPSDFVFAIEYQGTYKTEYTIKLLNIVGGKDILTTETGYKISFSDNTAKITFPSDFASEGEYKIYTTDTTSSSSLAPTTSEQTILFYKSGLLIKSPTVYLLKEKSMKTIPIELSSTLFKDRIDSVSYKKPSHTNPIAFDSSKYSLSPEKNVLTITNDAISFNIVGDYEFNIVLKENPQRTITHTITVFEYPIAINYINPIFIRNKVDDYLKITFNTNPIHSSIFKSIKTVGEGTEIISFTLGDRISEESATFDYKLLLPDEDNANYWKKYTQGIQFYDMDDNPITPLITTTKVLIVVKTEQYPTTITPSPIAIALDSKEVIVKFDSAQPVYSEYFISYESKSAIINIASPDKISYVSDSSIKITSTSALPKTIAFKSFEENVNVQITICEKYQIVDANKCKFCKELASEDPLYYEDGKCGSSCSDSNVYYDFICYDKCPKVDGEQYYASGKVCVKTCPNDSVGVGTVCVPLLKIKSITQPLYGMIDQATKSIITTDSITGYSGKFKILKDESLIADVTCASKGNPATEFECDLNWLQSIDAGNYEIKWGETLNTLSSEGLSFKISSVSSLTITSIAPKVKRLPTDASIKLPFTLTYAQDYQATQKIKLINVDYPETEIPVDSANIDTTNSSKKIVILNVDNTLPEGTYNIKTSKDSSADSKSETSIDSFTVYKENTISLSKDKETYEQGTNVSNLELIFKEPLFKSRIEKVEIKEGNSNTPGTFKLDTTDETKLIIENTITVKTTVIEIIITYKSETPNSTVTFTINNKLPDSGVYPSSATFTDTIYYHGSEPVLLEVTFNVAITTDNALSLIQTKKKMIKFKLSEPLDDTNMKFNLVLVDPTLSYTWGTHETIEFYKKDPEGSNKWLFESTPAGGFIILNGASIPRTLINGKLAYTTGNDPSTFDLIFKETVIEKYIDKKYLSLKDTTGCSMTFNSGSSQKVTVTCNPAITTTTEFIIKSFDQEIKFTVEVTECGSQPVINGECGNCSGTTPKLYNGICYEKCPDGKIEENNICYNSCELIPKYKDYYFNVADNTCIETCDTSSFTYVKGKRCYAACPLKYNGLNLYEHEKTCVENCENFFVSDMNNKCIEKTAQEECKNTNKEIQCITECPYGTYFSKEKDNCIYDSTITNSFSNTCEEGFCKNGGNCSIVNNKPVCTCKEEFYGSSCQNTITLNGSIKDHVGKEFKKIYDKEETEIEINHPKSISMVVELTTVISKDNTAISGVKDDDIISMSDNLINTIKTSVKGNIPQKNAVAFLSFTIKALIVKLNVIKASVLAPANPDIPSMERNLEVLVNEFLQSTATTELTQGDASIKLSKLIEDDGQSFKAQVYTQDAQSISASTSHAQQHKISTIDVSDIATKMGLTSYGIVKIDLIPDYLLSLTPTENWSTAESTTTSQQVLMKYAIVNLNKKKTIDISTMQNSIYLSLFPLNSVGGKTMSMDKYKYFMKKDIDISNPNDKVFTDPCYYNWALGFDLPQKYRYNDLYAGMSIGSTNENCIYKGFDTGRNTIVLECTVLANVDGVSVITKEIPLSLTVDKDHVDNLPTLCAGSIAAIAFNIAFWTYLVVFIFALIPTVIFGVIYLLSRTKGYIQSWIGSDDMASSYSRTAVTTEDVIQETDVKLEITSNKSFGELIQNNFKTVHPLTTICRGSVVTPLMLKISLLMYNISNLFGFNALFYNEDMIGKKIEDNNRDNFGYPMKSEFHKIVYSLLISMTFTMIVRAITLVTMSKKKELMKELDSAQSIDEKQLVCKKFWMGGVIQRIVAYLFMLVLGIFFFYYCVVFCGIYVNTQFGWFYSGLWSLFMDWVIFAPVSIVIITGVELKSPACGYYAKQLFWF